MKKILILLCFNISVIPDIYSQISKPELFVFSVGISKYQNSACNLRFAHKDALDLAEAWKKQKDLFDVREVKILVNEQATRANIRQELIDFKRKISSNDLFLFIYSGHGLNEALVPYDFDKKDRIATTVGKFDLMELISQLNCNYIALIDACHSGSFAKGIDLGKDINSDFVREQNLASQNLLRALSASDKANIVIGSSSSGEKSDECLSCENGYFTQCILDAFDGTNVVNTENQKKYFPDNDFDGFIYTNELDNYLKEAVSLVTSKNEIQQSVISKQSPGFNFPLIKLQDSDNDGVANIYDECKETKGTIKGCPDDDNDGVANKDDKCPNEKGDKLYFGCLSIENNKIIIPQPIIHVTKSNVFTKSLLFPGWGDKTLNQKSKKIWLGVFSYGALITGTVMQSKAKHYFNLYNAGFKPSQITVNRSQTVKYNNLSTVFWGISAAIWTFDLVSILTKKDLKVSPSNNGLSLNLSF